MSNSEYKEVSSVLSEDDSNNGDHPDAVDVVLVHNHVVGDGALPAAYAAARPPAAAAAVVEGGRGMAVGMTVLGVGFGGKNMKVGQEDFPGRMRMQVRRIEIQYQQIVAYVGICLQDPTHIVVNGI